MTWSREHALTLAAGSGWDLLDLSLGVPAEPSPGFTSESSGSMAQYPLSAGSDELRASIVHYFKRRFHVDLPMSAVAACAGGKEFISTLPLLLRNTWRGRAIASTAGSGRAAPVRAASVKAAPERDTALIPALGYPPYEFGARLAGLRIERVPLDATGRIDLSSIPDRLAERALYLWVNSPANPTGVIESDLAAIVEWGRARGVLILSDEAYAELTWTGARSSALATGLDGVLAVHSLSKRSNAPGLRIGFYAGDPILVSEILRLRRQAGLIAAEDSQRQATQLLDDDTHVEQLQARTLARLTGLVDLLNSYGLHSVLPQGGLFLWITAPTGDGVEFADQAASRAGLLVSPGIVYGPSGRSYVRLAAVCPAENVEPRLAALAAAGLLISPALSPSPALPPSPTPAPRPRSLRLSGISSAVSLASERTGSDGIERAPR